MEDIEKSEIVWTKQKLNLLPDNTSIWHTKDI